MNQLIEIKVNENLEPVVSGRELHEKLGVKTLYKDWFPRMTEYGFVENIDFVATAQKRATAQGNETTYTDHIMKLDMAKEIAMLQRNETGKTIRKYFIEVEKDYNSPEKIMSRALKYAEIELGKLKLENKAKDQQIEDLQPKATYYDLVLQCKNLVSVSVIAKDFGLTARELNTLLHDWKIQYKQGDIWLLYKEHGNMGYTQTKTNNIVRSNGTPDTSIHTYWTQKGRLFLYDLLKGKGYLPNIEKN